MYKLSIILLISINLLLLTLSILDDQRLERELTRINLHFNSEIQELSRIQEESRERERNSFKTALFLGDSYTAGAGASRPSNRFTTIFSRMNKLKEVNLAEGGTGYPMDLALKQKAPNPESLKACGKLYCNDYYEAFVEFESKYFLSPDFIFITGGRNNTRTSELKTSIPDFLKYVRDAFPKAKIFVISPIGDATPVPQNIIELRQILRTSLKVIPNAHYIDLRNPLLGHPEFLISDNVHPNDAGMRVIAGALDKAFKSIVKAK